MQEIINQITEVIPLQALLPILVIELLLILIALLSCLRSETKGPKWIWIIMIIFLQILGPILYFVIGRKNQ